MRVLGRFRKIGGNRIGKQIETNLSAYGILTGRKVFLQQIFGNYGDGIYASHVSRIEIAALEKRNAHVVEIGVADQIDPNLCAGRRQSVNIEFRRSAGVGGPSSEGGGYVFRTRKCAQAGEEPLVISLARRPVR